MPAAVIMPALEMAQTTGKVVHWLKSDGDAVTKGEPILEIETDKATIEVEAPASGILREVAAREGDVVPVGTTIARIYATGEPVAAAATPLPAAAAMPATPGPAAPAPPPAATVATRLAAASPKARRMAAERDVDLGAVRGSGPGGAVLSGDVLAAQVEPGGGTVWRIMAERMSASWTTAPHFYLVREVDATGLAAWLERSRRETGAHVTYSDLLVKLVASALVRHPGVNASFRDGAIVPGEGVHIGLAAVVRDGLLVPVIHDADGSSVAELAVRRLDLLGRARAGKLRPADLQGAGFTISNLGMYGVDAFSAILNPPQAAILAVGRIAPRVVAEAGRPAVKPTMVLTLSCDHRVLDGARAAGFLGELAESIEAPPP